MIGIDELQTSAHALIDVISTTYNLNNNQKSTNGTITSTSTSTSGPPKSILDIIFNNDNGSKVLNNENRAADGGSTSKPSVKEENVDSTNNGINVQKSSSVSTSSISPNLSSPIIPLQSARRASLGSMGSLPTPTNPPRRPHLPQGGNSSNLSITNTQSTLPTTISPTIITPAPGHPPLRRRSLGDTTVGLTSIKITSSNTSTPTTMPPPLIRRGSYGSTPISDANIRVVRNDISFARPPIRRHSTASTILTSNSSNNISSSELPAVIKLPSRRGSLGVVKEEDQMGGGDKEKAIRERCKRVGEAKEKIKVLKDKLKEVEVGGSKDISLLFDSRHAVLSLKSMVVHDV